MKTSQPFRKLLAEFPKQFPVGLKAANAAWRLDNQPIRRLVSRLVAQSPNHLIICGMGGSALPGALLQNLQRIEPRLAKRHLHFVVHRDYGLPPETFTAKAIVICVSYSGDTEETISAYLAARKAKLPVLAIASGGVLTQLAKRDRIPYAVIPQGIPPRFAVGYQFSALIGLLGKTGLLPQSLVKETKNLERTLKPAKEFVSAGPLVKMFLGSPKIPLILSSPNLYAAAYSWGTNVQENTKLPAQVFFFPELDHNLLNAFAPIGRGRAHILSHLGVIIAQDANDSRRTKARIAATARLIKTSGVPVSMFTIVKPSPLARLFKTYLLGLTFSGLLAEKLGIDPIPVPMIERLKTLLK